MLYKRDQLQCGIGNCQWTHDQPDRMNSLVLLLQSQISRGKNLFLKRMQVSFFFILPSEIRCLTYFSRRNHSMKSVSACLNSIQSLRVGIRTICKWESPLTLQIHSKQQMMAFQKEAPYFEQLSCTTFLQQGEINALSTFLRMQPQMFFSYLGLGSLLESLTSDVGVCSSVKMSSWSTEGYLLKTKPSSRISNSSSGSSPGLQSQDQYANNWPVEITPKMSSKSQPDFGNKSITNCYEQNIFQCQIWPMLIIYNNRPKNVLQASTNTCLCGVTLPHQSRPVPGLILGSIVVLANHCFLARPTPAETHLPFSLSLDLYFLMTQRSVNITIILPIVTAMEDSYLQDLSQRVTYDQSSTVSRCPSTLLLSPKSKTARLINSNKSKNAGKPLLTDRSFKRVLTTNNENTLSTKQLGKGWQTSQQHPIKSHLPSEWEQLTVQNRQLVKRQEYLVSHTRKLQDQNQKLRGKLEAFSKINQRISTLQSLNQALQEQLEIAVAHCQQISIQQTPL